MIRLTVLYGQPDDTEAFERHYRDVHIPLAKKLPGLRRYTISRGVTVAFGEDPAYLVAELDFDDLAAMQAGMGTPEGKEAGRDMVANLASGGVRNLVYEVEEV
jgi:uncharacterized protein (TIGR02118 family)